MIIDRPIRRYNAESWSRVIAKPWIEIIQKSPAGHSRPKSLNNGSSGQTYDIPLPVSLVIIDLPDSDRARSVILAFDILWDNDRH